jgi:hypothetical protein
MRCASFPRLGIAAGLAAVLAGCDPSEPTVYLPRYEPTEVRPIPQMSFCPLLAEQTCAVLRPCCEASPFAFDEARCRAVSRSLCEAWRQRSIDAGLVYDPWLAARCAAAASTLVEDCRAVDAQLDPLAAETTRACQQVWNRAVPLGEACVATDVLSCMQPHDVSSQCLGGWCRRTTYLEAGALCGGSCPTCACAPGLACRGDPLRCSAIYHPLGAPCLVDEECGPCTGAIDARLCAVRCACAGGAAVCPATERRCSRYPGLGEPCARGRCDEGLRCEVGDEERCVIGKRDGVPCASDFDCASGHCELVCRSKGIAEPYACDGAPHAATGGGGFFDLLPIASR